MGEKFADPDVDETTKDRMRELACSHGPTEPWVLLDQAEEDGIHKRDARRALRGLKLSNEIVPADDLTGKVQLVRD